MAQANVQLNMKNIQEAFRPLRLLVISSEVVNEIASAREKHGPNDDLAYGTGPARSALREASVYGLVADHDGEPFDNDDIAQAFKNLNDNLCAKGRKHTRLGILLEEAFEAAETADPAELRAELIQVAAMAMDWVADIDAAAGKADA